MQLRHCEDRPNVASAIIEELPKTLYSGVLSQRPLLQRDGELVRAERPSSFGRPFARLLPCPRWIEVILRVIGEARSA